VTVAERRLRAREATISTSLAAALAAILLWTAPPGIDWAAHAYQRTFLLDHGFTIWNNFWYAGRYSFVTYSVLYYPLAALLGIRVLALASVSAAAFAFSMVVFRQWGPVSRLSSRTFAVLWVGIIGAAAFPFALAMSFALLALWALQEQRRGRFAVCAVLTVLASPLAFAFLVVVLAGAALSRRSVSGSRPQIAVVLFGAAFELVLNRLFGDGGRFPYGLLQLAPSLIFVGLGLLVTRDVPQARLLRGMFWTYLAVCVTAYVVPSSIGSNLERLRYVALPVALIAVALRRWRPLWLVLPSVVLAAVWNTTPIYSTFARAGTDPEASRAYWQPSIAFLKAHLSPSYRVEVVDTAEHWAAAYLPDAGIPIVRGWYRQSDFPQNALLYEGTLGAASYEAWLRRMAVRYVIVPDAPSDYSARDEAALVQSGVTSLVPVAWTLHTTIYELPRATPIVTGPSPATVMYLYPSRLVFEASKPGTYRVRVRWSPYWHATSGCVGRTRDGMTTVRMSQAGLVSLGFAVSVSRGLETLAGTIPGCSKTRER
jgi:hypothetical protein